MTVYIQVQGRPRFEMFCPDSERLSDDYRLFVLIRHCTFCQHFCFVIIKTVFKIRTVVCISFCLRLLQANIFLLFEFYHDSNQCSDKNEKQRTKCISETLKCSLRINHEQLLRTVTTDGKIPVLILSIRSCC